MTQPCRAGGARGADAGDGCQRAERDVVNGAGLIASPEGEGQTAGGCVPVGAVAMAQSKQLCACSTTHDELDSDSMCAIACRWSNRHASATAATEGATIWKRASSTRIRESRGCREKRMAGIGSKVQASRGVELPQRPIEV